MTSKSFKYGYEGDPENGNPWDRAPREGAKAYEAFTTYLNQGATRSLPYTARTLNKSVHAINKWSANWCWVQRATAFDTYISDQTTQQLIQERIAANKQMKVMSTAMLNKVAQRIIDINPDEIPPSTLLRMMVVAGDLRDKLINAELGQDAPEKEITLVIKREDFEGL